MSIYRYQELNWDCSKRVFSFINSVLYFLPKALLRKHWVIRLDKEKGSTKKHSQVFCYFLRRSRKQKMLQENRKVIREWLDVPSSPSLYYLPSNWHVKGMIGMIDRVFVVYHRRGSSHRYQKEISEKSISNSRWIYQIYVYHTLTRNK